MSEHASLPPLLLTSDPGSFAHNTLKVRVPRILRDTIDANDFPRDALARLEALHAELTGGRIRALEEDAADVERWNRWSAPYVGRTWLDVPWYWAEAYFYRRLLEATGYFQPGPLQAVDPFAPIKRKEWAAEAAPAAVNAVLANLANHPQTRFEQVLHASLWGNRTDLSYTIAAHLGATAAPGQERSNLLVDDWAAVWDHLTNREKNKVAIIADNAGTELLMDALLADFLLDAGLASEVHLHLKPQPFYVSDAMKQDLADGTDALIEAGGVLARLGRRVDGAVAGGEIALKTHPFYCSPLFYPEMPARLRATLAEMNLVVVKGDANYRRLVEDRHWPHTTPFAQVTAHFPAPVVALRTFKSELVVGLAAGQAEREAATDPEWLVNGRRGVIQAAIQRRADGWDDDLL
ncbi:MAG: damage-control phosphatase ARMT1 family protein [Anaerolineae bacterium]|nr:damage-control phosphatase ARMT1 family protein [Anaerolineae bacterium]